MQYLILKQRYEISAILQGIYHKRTFCRCDDFDTDIYYLFVLSSYFILITYIMIRFATAADASLLSLLSETTFRETYWGTDTDENILSHIANSFNIPKITEEIADINLNHYLIVENESNQAVGYARMRYDQELKPNNLQSKKALEIARIYVLKEFQGQKTGQLLLEYIEKFAKQEDFDTIWFCVWKDNFNAIRFYKRHGFEIIGEYVFKLGSSTYIDWAMAKQL
jgi:ribosomal protein S18 acetylase RimI-like enzyme